MGAWESDRDGRYNSRPVYVVNTSDLFYCFPYARSLLPDPAYYGNRARGRRPVQLLIGVSLISIDLYFCHSLQTKYEKETASLTMIMANLSASNINGFRMSWPSQLERIQGEVSIANVECS